MSVAGKVVDGRFRLERSIGRGGMGEVYLATDLHTMRPVAVKVLRAVCAGSGDAHLRLTREIDVLSRLHGPHIAELFSAGHLADSSPYFVMEYLEGRDMRAELRLRGALPIAEAAAYLVQACRGVNVAHELGIVHRDLKPPNLFITNLHAARQLKLVDFGVAKLLDSVDATLTATDTIVGTPLYLAPELLLNSKATSTKVDIWALGVMLYEFLAGYTPFHDDSPGAVIAAITLDEPVPIRQIRPDVPPEIEELVAAALTKAPARRLDSVVEFEQRLLPFAAPPDQILVPDTDEQSTCVAPKRLPRARSQVDLRQQIREAVDAGAQVGDSRSRHGLELVPDPERRGAVPSLRRLSIPALQTAKTRNHAQSDSPTVEQATLPRMRKGATPAASTATTSPESHLPNKRWLFALPLVLSFALVLALWNPIQRNIIAVVAPAGSSTIQPSREALEFAIIEHRNDSEESVVGVATSEPVTQAEAELSRSSISETASEVQPPSSARGTKKPLASQQPPSPRQQPKALPAKSEAALGVPLRL